LPPRSQKSEEGSGDCQGGGTIKTHSVHKGYLGIQGFGGVSQLAVNDSPDGNAIP
jgi:hypothetical protein